MEVIKAMNFICKTTEFNTAEKHIPMPLMRKVFEVGEGVRQVLLEIGSLGYYEAHINGKNITKGEMAPYRSAPCDYVYYDKYDITDSIKQGENVLGVMLGNGIQCSVEPTWNFDSLPWRSSPAVDFEITLVYSDREEKILSDSSTVCCDSPITFNDFHYGEHYDARLEIIGWDSPDFDDSEWTPAIEREAPTGEKRFCTVQPIVRKGEMAPVDIIRYKDGYIYDFGVNHAGLTRLKVKGECGQEITTLHFEVMLEDGTPYFRNLQFRPENFIQKDIYICKGEGIETHIPRFLYHGFRYVYVTGITEAQATKDLLTFVIIHSDLEQISEFECDVDVINKIQEITLRADFSNFHYFPTDCPHREKNGWTADAALSAEQMLMNMNPEKSYAQWMKNIYKAQDSRGALPGIVPTGGWGFDWGNGPAWDQILVGIPFDTYKYRGDISIFDGIAKPLMKYILYTKTRLDGRGLIAIGLGDWCQTGRASGSPTTPLVVTDSIVLKSILHRAAFVYKVLGLDDYRDVCVEYEKELTNAIREHLIDTENKCVNCLTQTGQAMAIYYGVFDESEREDAVKQLVKFIKADDSHMNVGVLGGRVLFRVLAENGEGDLALSLITRRDFPSYANLIEQGATTLWENFRAEKSTHISSRNHHFWGDISAWFMTYIGGLRINPECTDVNNVNIEPIFFDKIGKARVKYTHACGEIECRWERNKNSITVDVSVPEGIHGKLILKDKIYKLESGRYTV